MGHEVVEIDVAAGIVKALENATGTLSEEPFDQLLLGTGGRAIRPNIPGIDLPHVLVAHTLDDAQALHSIADARMGDDSWNVVVIGAGYIGLEMAEAFVTRGHRPVLVDLQDYPLPGLVPELGVLVKGCVEHSGVEFIGGTEVTAITPESVVCGDRELPADLVVISVGTAPCSELAAAAGIELGAGRAIAVDERMQTSAEGVFAAGDCATSRHLITGKQVFFPLGTNANKHARVAGINIGGGQARMPGVLGTAVTRYLELEIATTGLSLDQAQAAGIDACSEQISTLTKPGYMPDSSTAQVVLVAERGSGRVLGGQIVGGSGSAKRIDTIATAATASMSVAQLLDTDLAYAPPFSTVWDMVAVAARELLKKV